MRWRRKKTDKQAEITRLKASIYNFLFFSYLSFFFNFSKEKTIFYYFSNSQYFIFFIFFIWHKYLNKLTLLLLTHPLNY